MTALQQLLDSYRTQSQTEREKGTYFEELILVYFRHESTYADLYSDVWLYSDWAKEYGRDGKDTGIDLVAKTRGTDEYHAIQCKCYAEDYRLRKADIDSFFTASGQKPFSHRIIVSTTNNWSDNAEAALVGQQPPVNKIDLDALEASQIDWSNYAPGKPVALKEKKVLRPHQETALARVKAGLATADRGKLIMACGTGKTFTSLKIAETLAGKGKRVLFLVPSLSLLSQTLSEWTQETATPLHSFAVCSDSDVGKKRKKDDDVVQTFAHELRYPATTNAARLAQEMGKRHEASHMSVVFSTYHSIDVISKAQHEYDLADFDLIICDEAHRTTGATFAGEGESAFVKVHNADFIRSAKRLYMTATPRIYGDNAKISAELDDVALCSMDDKKLFGNVLHVITFSEAVKRGLLVDYKVIVLAVDAKHVSARLQSLWKDENNTLKVDDAAKIVGCWKALSKHHMEEGVEDDMEPMRRAVAFCQVIEAQKPGARSHKVSSKQISSMFSAVVEAYQEQEEDHGTLHCEAAHVDGAMSASQKEEKLNWLKAQSPEDTCRILSNVRCLSEGVDVPALDAVLFLTPRNSQVDVVQSVGRVMRNAPGKKRGYVILPVVIPEGMEPHEALSDNKTYKVVWEVLQALRSHDDRFDAHINKLKFDGKDTTKMEVIAVTDNIQKKSDAPKGKKDKARAKAKGGQNIGADAPGQMKDQTGMEFDVGDIERALYAKIVKKCGNRMHWEQWANDIAKIAQTHITRITTIIENPANTKEVAAFTAFADELRDDLNDAITNAEVVEMLAQHLITKPVFDALFEGYSFASNNPVSKAMQHVLDILQEHRLNKEADTLEAFYDSVKMRVEGTNTAEGKQKIIVELYDKFFSKAFPRLKEKLGIVYTPVEVVDFIIHSVNDLLQQEFGQTLGSEGVHIIDPFTGTGTFITRLLQSGLISPEQLAHKYKKEIHANEIVLLAYYIAAINIEAVYHGLAGGGYVPFDGICLTDTFQMYEKDDLVSDMMVDNSKRRKRQKDLDIRVIMGNPPYSVGQDSANDDNQNVAYPGLDSRIKDTYVEYSQATLNRNLFDPYIRAIRWGSDRLGDSGVMGYVSGSAWVERSFGDGMRKVLAEEFSNLYVIHLRGDIRKNMMSKGRAKEGGNIFDSNCMTGIAITFFVKNPSATSHGNIYFYNIGDDLTTDEKRSALKGLGAIKGIENGGGWVKLTPNKHFDWLEQRTEETEKFIKLGTKDKADTSDVIFSNYSLGVGTNRDPWCCNFSNVGLKKNIVSMIKTYNSQVTKAISEEELCLDLTKIKWTRSLKEAHAKGNKHSGFSLDSVRTTIYRPFVKTKLYFDSMLNESPGKNRILFPLEAYDNKVIDIAGIGARSGFSVLITDRVVNLDTIEKGQCFPLYLYEKINEVSVNKNDLFAEQTTPDENGYVRKDGINDAGLAHFQTAYPAETFSKEDLFYYIYGLLHSEEYRSRYADNLSKELPRIPAVKTAKDFWAFSKAGRQLAEFHLNYETVEMYPAKVEGGAVGDDYRVEKMKHPKIKVDGKSVNDKSVLLYNKKITVSDIPLEAYEYIVNGKPALDWVMDRQCVKTDKKSGIVNDANDWANETMNNPKYPLELFLRVITVSLETVKIVNVLPKLDID